MCGSWAAGLILPGFSSAVGLLGPIPSVPLPGSSWVKRYEGLGLGSQVPVPAGVVSTTEAVIGLLMCPTVVSAGSEIYHAVFSPDPASGVAEEDLLGCRGLG